MRYLPAIALAAASATVIVEYTTSSDVRELVLIEATHSLIVGEAKVSWLRGCFKKFAVT